MEFLLVNHPLDCPICDQAGECSLQEYATDYGRGYSRFTDQKNPKPKRVQVGPRVTLDNERCILCSRCVRFCDEVDEDPVLGIVERGSYSMIATHPGRQLDSNYSLNTVDICPVGALTSTDFRFKMRVWFLKPTRSICTESSAGVNTEVWSREGKIYRITPRRNDAVNDTWMPDSGRMLYKQVEAEDRLRAYQSHAAMTTLPVALDTFSEYAKASPVALVLSGDQSLEECFQAKRLAEALEARVYVVGRQRQGDGRLISEDGSPNARGTLLTGLTTQAPAMNLEGLESDLLAGKVSTVLAYNVDLSAFGVSTQALQKAQVVYLGTHENTTSRTAALVLPTLTVFEKSGSFINRQCRLQTFLQAVPGGPGLLPDVTLLERLIASVTGAAASTPSIHTIWEKMAAECAPLKGLSFAAVGEAGQLLDPAFCEGAQFLEQTGWHFEPAGANTATPA